jgi:hypothetical protein
MQSIAKDDSMSDILPFSMPVLVHQSLRDSICTFGETFLDSISTFSLELTLNTLSFWDRILQRANDRLGYQ